MTHNDIIKSAITISGELQVNATGDYTVRAFTLLALLYDQCLPLDRVYRQANGLPESSWTPDTEIHNENDDFPLADVFLGIIPYALASLLVIDENTELSNLLYARYVAGLSEIRKAIPASVEPTVDRYHFF